MKSATIILFERTHPNRDLSSMSLARSVSLSIFIYASSSIVRIDDTIMNECKQILHKYWIANFGSWENRQRVVLLLKSFAPMFVDP